MQTRAAAMIAAAAPKKAAPMTVDASGQFDRTHE